MPPEMSAPVIIVPPILFFVLSSIGQFCHGVSQATLKRIPSLINSNTTQRQITPRATTAITMSSMEVTIYEVAYATRNNKRTGTIKGYRNTAK